MIKLFSVKVRGHGQEDGRNKGGRRLTRIPRMRTCRKSSARRCVEAQEANGEGNRNGADDGKRPQAEASDGKAVQKQSPGELRLQKGGLDRGGEVCDRGGVEWHVDEADDGTST